MTFIIINPPVILVLVSLHHIWAARLQLRGQTENRSAYKWARVPRFPWKFVLHHVRKWIVDVDCATANRTLLCRIFVPRKESSRRAAWPIADDFIDDYTNRMDLLMANLFITGIIRYLIFMYCRSKFESLQRLVCRDKVYRYNCDFWTHLFPKQS